MLVPISPSSVPPANAMETVSFTWLMISLIPSTTFALCDINTIPTFAIWDHAPSWMTSAKASTDKKKILHLDQDVRLNALSYKMHGLWLPLYPWYFPLLLWQFVKSRQHEIDFLFLAGLLPDTKHQALFFLLHLLFLFVLCRCMHLLHLLQKYRT